jgi:DNA-binding PadR family transcriptional regulator
MKPLIREILLSFWKIHILHHAARGPVYGLWMIEELSEHGYKVSPGTIYPIFKRMEKNRWLYSYEETVSGKVRKYYRLTDKGAEVLAYVRGVVAELHREVVLGRESKLEKQR